MPESEDIGLHVLAPEENPGEQVDSFNVE